MYPIIINKSDNLVSAIEEKMKLNQSIEMKDVLNRFTVDIISSVAFGMEADTLKNQNERLIVMFREVFGSDALMKIFFQFAFPKLSKFLNISLFTQNVTTFFTDVLVNNVKYRESSNDKRNDFLNMLIQLKNKGSIDGEISSETKKLNMNEIMAQAFLFFFAGADTSSTTMAFALIELGRNLEIQDRVRKEVLEKSKGEITYEALMEMNYLNQVVNGEKNDFILNLIDSLFLRNPSNAQSRSI